jgi:hypothetical protein
MATLKPDGEAIRAPYQHPEVTVSVLQRLGRRLGAGQRGHPNGHAVLTRLGGVHVLTCSNELTARTILIEMEEYLKGGKGDDP